jgi:hypothetical protein
MTQTLEQEADIEEHTSIDQRTCIVCGDTFSYHERVASPEYQELHLDREASFYVDPAKCCDNRCMMMGISIKANDPHIKY